MLKFELILSIQKQILIFLIMLLAAYCCLHVYYSIYIANQNEFLHFHDVSIIQYILDF